MSLPADGLAVLPSRAPRAADLFAPRYRTLTLGLVLTITLVAFEALATGTIMPLVAGDLGGFEYYGWTFSAFFLGNLIGIVVTGGLLDRGSIVRPFAAGLILFAIGLTLGGLAPSMPVFVAARFLQGLGAGAVNPTSYVAIGRSIPESLRPRMFAMLSTAWVVPGLMGPAIAGIVADAFHWRAVFLGLLPLLAASGALAILALRSVPGPTASEHEVTASTSRRLAEGAPHGGRGGPPRRVPHELAAAPAHRRRVAGSRDAGARVPVAHPEGDPPRRRRAAGGGVPARAPHVLVLRRGRVCAAAAA